MAFTSLPGHRTGFNLKQSGEAAEQPPRAWRRVRIRSDTYEPALRARIALIIPGPSLLTLIPEGLVLGCVLNCALRPVALGLIATGRPKIAAMTLKNAGSLR